MPEAAVMARAHVCKLGGRSWNTKAVGRTNAGRRAGIRSGIASVGG